MLRDGVLSRRKTTDAERAAPGSGGETSRSAGLIPQAAGNRGMGSKGSIGLSAADCRVVGAAIFPSATDGSVVPAD